MNLAVRALSVLIFAASVNGAGAQPVQKQYPRCYEISFNPILQTQPGSPRLHAYMGWHNPATEVYDYMAGMQIGSNGIVNERLTTYLEMNFWPVKIDGFQYAEAQYLAGDWHFPDGVDYDTVIRDYDFARRVDRGEIDEVFMNGAPYFGYWESTAAGYNSFYCNSGPRERIPCSRVFIIMGWNYERIVSLHATGHRTESILSMVYNGWDVNGDRTIWDRYGWNHGQTTISGVYGIGSAHLPANADDHYDYANPQWVESFAPQWASFAPDLGPSFPDPSGATAQVSRDTWGDTPTSHEMAYFIWWYQHMPHIADTNGYDGYERLNNWWEYIYNFNAHPESNGDHVAGGPAPPAEPLGASVVALTEDTRDDWTPQINSAGRVVWKQFDYGLKRWWIRSANADGGDAVTLGPALRGVSDPRLNDAGQVVWSGFDGRDFEIYVAQADGSFAARRTNNAVNDLQPDINGSGRIVWYRWDGTDYEIVSADFDGANEVQITNRDYAGVGLRPDDVWPRINASNRVAWMSFDGVNWEVFSANADGTELVQITSGAYKNEYPQIGAGGKIVWHAWHSDDNAEIWEAHADGTGLERLTTNNVRDWWPQINTGNEVVWMQRNAGDWEILHYSAATGTTLVTTNATHDQYPAIDDEGRIVWQGFDGNDWEIYADEDGVIYQVTDNDYDDWAPQLRTGGEIVWHAESRLGDPADPDYGGPQTEIFATVESPPLCAGDLDCDGVIDFDDIDPFVAALGCQGGDPNCWDPGCPWLNGDCNDDGTVDFDDIDSFVARIGATCP